MDKVAIIVHTDVVTDEDLARALHGVVYAKELAEKGAKVKLLFDGAGTKWVGKIVNGSDNPFTKEFATLEMDAYSGIEKGVCSYCSGVFGVDKGDINKAGMEIISEYEGHPDIAKLIENGYQIITL